MAALVAQATDLGARGVDKIYGNGLVGEELRPPEQLASARADRRKIGLREASEASASAGKGVSPAQAAGLSALALPGRGGEGTARAPDELLLLRPRPMCRKAAGRRHLCPTAADSTVAGAARVESGHYVKRQFIF